MCQRPPSLVPAIAALLMGMAGLGEAAPSAPHAPPQALQTVQLVYPDTVDLDWSTGQVTLAYVVDAQGRIGEVEVLRGAHPAFTDAALDALLATPYRPAMREGVPIAMRVQRDHRFTLQHHGVGAVLNLQGPARRGSERAELAPALQQAVWPVYPAALLRAGVTGSARVRAHIAAQGQVDHVELLSASHPAFGQAALAMMWAWRFDPIVAAGQPQRQLEYEQRFSAARPAESGVPAATGTLLERLAQGGTGIAGAADLDGPLRLRLQVAPVTPPSLRQARSAGRATLSFHVDPTGRVLLPEVVTTSQEDFGWAALTALNQWRFEPPRQGGRPAMVRAQVELKVEAPP